MNIDVLSNMSSENTACKQTRYNPFVKSKCKRNTELERIFAEFNDKYFSRRILPKYKVYLCSKSKNFGHFSAGFCSDPDAKIYIRSGMSEKATLWTLVHEMAHAKLSNSAREVHGRIFVQELRRLRKLGAPLSPLDVDVVKSGKNRVGRRTEKKTADRGNQGKSKISSSVIEPIALRKAIFDGHFIEGLSKDHIPKYLEREFEIPFSEIKRRVDVAKMIQEVFSG